MPTRRARQTQGSGGGAAAIANSVASGVMDTIARTGVIGIVRAASADRFGEVCATLIEAGVRSVEITLTTPGAVDAIGALRRRYADEPGVLIGAGTVLTTDDAEACVEAGAQFLVSPIAAPDVIASAKLAHVAVIAGALTPTEISTAYFGGADAVKIFPASCVVPGFVRDVHGPLPGIPLIPTGGIAIRDVTAWLRAGAVAVGLGGSLQGDSCAADGNIAALRRRARSAVNAVAQARESQE